MFRFRAFVTVAVIVVSIHGLANADPIIELRPVSASGAHTIVGNQITLDAPGQRVFLEVFVSNWDPDLNGDPVVAGLQAWLDSSGYTSGTLGQLAPATEPCTGDAECGTAFGPLSFCGYTGHPNDCTPGFQDITRGDWILNGVPGIPAMDTATLNFRWGGAVVVGGQVDSGVPGYLGTLVLDVVAGTNGKFTLGFNPEPDSNLLDGSLLNISPLSLVPATIIVECQSSADCDDGNACTDDTCQPDNSCTFQPNYNETFFCCNPADRALTAIDDGNACTTGVCDPADGSVTQDPQPSGTTCGNAPVDACDAQDTCDGAGVCVDRFEPSATACGDPTENSCNHADTCDGSGVCLTNLEASGASCGDPTDTTCNPADTCDGLGACQTILAPILTTCGDPSDAECDDPDTCDGAGACLTNESPSGLPCGDPIGDQCDNPDSCDGAGTCQSNAVPAGIACGNPGSSECDNPDSCDGAGACVANHLPDDTACTDDGNECRDDLCLSGVCSHPLTAAGVSCGSATATECNGADTCDGAGACGTNLQPGGAACGDPTTTDCDRADTCDGNGDCLTNLEPTGFSCGNASDTDCDSPDTCDGGGACLANVAPAGLPCGNEVGNQCDNPDSCDGAGLCEANFVLAGTTCGNPVDSECDNPDTCDGSGVCDPNHELGGTICTDDGNDCRDDICQGGVCSHPLSAPGAPCGDPTAAGCDDPDACDGAGTCLPELVPAGVPCGDGGDTLCTDPDTCNGFGSCLPNDAPDASSCDDGSFCDAGATCLAGVCGGGSAIDCDDGLTCTTDSCNEAAQQCDHDLIESNCLIGGECFKENESNPANDCQVCVTFVDDTDWTVLPVGSACDDRDTCTGTGAPGIGFDECDAAGVCSGTTDPDCNDDCVNGVPVFDGANFGNNENRGPDDDEAVCQFDSDNDVWFIYTAPCTGPVSMDTIGSSFAPSNDTVLTVYEVCGGEETACDDDDGPGLLSSLGFNAVAGTDYRIRVAGFMENAGDIVLNIGALDGCVIDGQCFANGFTNPANLCEACIPILNSTGWSNRAAGSLCGDPTVTECDSADACDGAGTCETNNKADQESCSDDGNDCTNDFCLAGVCSHPAKGAGTACGDPTVLACDNADTCDGTGLCLSNFAPTGLPCGDPATSECDNADSCDGAGLCAVNHQADGLACGDDGIECTQDACDSGLCEHPPRPSGTACGDAGDTECDNPDTCDGVGGCVSNFEASATACGDPSVTECDSADTCDGGGLCRVNHIAVGVACGSGEDTGCDNPDTCDGSGACRINLEPVGFPCGDPSSTQCDNPDTCDGGGACLANFEPIGLTCGDSGISECDNSDSCDGAGACAANNQPDGLACTDDGNECSADACDAGVCSHPPRASGTTCGNSGDTSCDDPDTCDGAGLCLSNFEPTGTTCGSPNDTDCDNADTCDGGGLCQNNFELTGTLCGDPTDDDCNNADTCDGDGVCLDNFEIIGLPCGDPANTQCDNPDTCDGGGACLDNFVLATTPCGDASKSECDNADSCDGGGACGLNHVLDGTVCTDDGNDCRDDVCDSGACAHPVKPSGADCGDPTDTECNDPDTCDGGGACLDNFVAAETACGDPSSDQCDNADICDGAGDCDDNFVADGTTCDDVDICTGADACASGLCVGVAIPVAPNVSSLGCRYIVVSAKPIGSPAPVALRVTSPDWPCLDKYLDANGEVVDAPVVRLPSEWGSLFVTGKSIAPSSTYHVVAECGSYQSPVGSGTTALWGDTVGFFNGTFWDPPDGSVNITDILAILEGFSGVPSAPEIQRIDLDPCQPNGSIDIADALRGVDAFSGLLYPCLRPCP